MNASSMTELLRTNVRRMAVIGVCALVVACGGGSTPDPTPQQPIAKTVIASVSSSAGVPIGLMLQAAGFADLPVQNVGDAAFVGAVTLGQQVQVSVKAQPPGQVCAVLVGPQLMSAADMRIPVVCTAGTLVPPNQAKPLVIGAPAPNAVLLGGQVSFGLLEVVPTGDGQAPSDFKITVQEGLIQEVTPVGSGQFAFRVATAGLAPGEYPYVLRVTKSSNGAYSLIQGKFVIAQPTAKATFNLTKTGGEFSVDVKRKVIVEANGLASPVKVDVLIGPGNDGRETLIFRFDRNLSGTPIRAVLAFDTQVKSSDPLPGSASARWNIGSQKTILQWIDTGLRRIGITAAATTAINLMPYEVPSTLPASVSKPLIANGLGKLWIQGAPVAFDNGFVTQGFFNVGKTFKFLKAKAGLDGLSDEDAKKALDEEKSAWTPRFWDTIPLNPPPEGKLDQFFDFFQWVSVSLSPAYEVHTVIKDDPSKFDWENHEPILFVHGFSPNVGGGAGTWSKFPNLAMSTAIPSARKLIPFEFHWRTNQSFRTAGDDLAYVIDQIHKVTNRPIHVVAHSFGGVLVRTVLQGQSRNPTPVNGKIASLTTLGSPHAGISQVEQTLGNATLPAGQDSTSFDGCWQVTCFEMGEPVSWGLFGLISSKDEYGLTGDYTSPGRHAAALFESRASLPDIPIFVGLGLVVHKTKPDLTPLPAPLVGLGDNLISFAGQRFVAGGDALSQAGPLLNNELIGKATITESILGLPSVLRPGSLVIGTQLPTSRQLGYLHSSVTGITSFTSIFNLFAEDWNNGRGLMAAPTFECDVPETCLHAGYRLFQLAVGSPLNLSNRQLAQAQTLPPAPLMPSTAIDAPVWTASQKAELRSMLRDLYGRNAVSGTAIRWAAVPSAERARYLSRLSFVPVPSGWSELHSSQLRTLNAFEEKKVKDANLRASFSALMWDSETAGLYLSLIENIGKMFLGEVKLVYPAQAMAVDKGAEIFVNTEAGVVALLDKFRTLSKVQPFVDLLDSCGAGLGLEFAKAIETVAADKRGAAAWVALLTTPIDCLASGFELADLKGSSKLAALLSASAGTVEGTNIVMGQFLIETLTQALDLLPNRPYKTRLQGLAEVVGALWDSYAIGVEFASRADKIFYVEKDKIEAAIERLRAGVDQQRTMQWLGAKGNLAFDLDPSGASIAFVPQTPTAGAAVGFQISEVWGLVKSVVVTFSDGIGQVVRAVLPDSTVATFEHVFAIIGAYVAEIKFMAGDAGTGTVLAVKPIAVNVGAAEPKVTDVQPRQVTAGISYRFGVVGTALPAGLKFQLLECANITELPGGTATRRDFSCAFPASTKAGNYAGTVATSTNPFAGGAPLYSFSVDVGAAPLPVVGPISPATALRGLAGSFEVTGQNLPTTGLTVVPLGDTRSNCQVPHNAKATGFGVACELFKVGPQTLELRQGTAVLKSWVVNVASNVTGVTWVSPSTNASGTVKFGEMVTFTVKGERLNTDPLMGFAVEKCGTSSTELPGGTDTARQFQCLFNNDAGAVAGQMPGVVKDLRNGTGQVLFDGWKVPVEVPLAPTVTSKLPHTGTKPTQCYAAGSNALVSCTSAAALALNSQQDGMRADINTMAYSALPKPSGGVYDLTECVKDNVTGLVWEGKTANGVRAGNARYTNFGDGRADDASAYVTAVNGQALCGASNWRLPTVAELQTLVDYGVAYPGLTLTVAWFPNTGGNLYWSSSPYVGDSTYAWHVHFVNGYVYYDNRFSAYQVRLVRASQ